MKCKNISFCIFIVAATSLLFTGCFRFIDSALDSAGRTAGESVGSSIGDSVGRSFEHRIQSSLSPMMASWYVNSMFAVAFGAGGYAPPEMDYAPGQWTRWQGVYDGEGWMERAFIGIDDNNNQWWRVKFHDSSEDETFVLEGLFSPDRGRMLRLRRLFPGDEGPVEMPVDKESYYAPPRHIAEESLEGARVGTVEISVPAGTFMADHIRFGDAGGGTWEWWISKQVPGGIVRYAQKAPGSHDDDHDEGFDPNQYDIRLLSYGSDAVSELGVM